MAGTRRYTVGPTVELRLPFGLAAEFDALYKRFGYDRDWDLIGARATFRTTVNAWEFPLQAKFRFEAPLNPFLAGGISYRRLAGTKQVMDRAVPARQGAWLMGDRCPLARGFLHHGAHVALHFGRYGVEARLAEGPHHGGGQEGGDAVALFVAIHGDAAWQGA